MKIAGKMSLSSRQWLNRQNRDIFVKKANSAGYRSRAIFKLIEIDDKFKLIRNANRIIDLGAAPGGWSQLISARSNANAKIASVDLRSFPDIDGVQQFCGDFEDESTKSAVVHYLEQKADLIVSDVAPSATGHRKTDHARIMRLAESAFFFVQDMLQNNGAFVVKIFQGGEEKQFAESMKEFFQKIHFFKPEASRCESREIYLVAIGFKHAI